jgi:hypothetical protein
MESYGYSVAGSIAFRVRRLANAIQENWKTQDSLKLIAAGVKELTNTIGKRGLVTDQRFATLVTQTKSESRPRGSS